jgi:hypothetical protein
MLNSRLPEGRPAAVMLDLIRHPDEKKQVSFNKKNIVKHNA